MELKDIIEARLWQLENRKMMIPRYVERPEAFLGKKDFSLNDLPKIDQQINECNTCLEALKNIKKS